MGRVLRAHWRVLAPGKEAFMKRVDKNQCTHLSEEDVADQIVENNPAFKIRIERAFAEYKANGGIDAARLTRTFEKLLKESDIK